MNDPLRIVTDDDVSPLTRDEALDTITEHWKAARAAYAETIQAIGHQSLVYLIQPPGDKIDRWRMQLIRDHARDVARHATRMADQLDQAAGAYKRARP